MQAFLLSTGIVALAEMGDKTQLLALLLAARFRRPLPIICGILAATLLNHAIAGAVGGWLVHTLPHTVLPWVLGASFMVMAGWMLIPDQVDSHQALSAAPHALSIAATTFTTFFIAEIGDKTQLATLALAAQQADNWRHIVNVIAGTSLGMLLANVPVVLIGERFSTRLPLRWIRWIGAVVFVGLAVGAMVGRQWVG